MDNNITRQALATLAPPGPLWVVKIDEGFDQLLDGVAANAEAVNDFLDCLGCVRDPFTTPFLEDLEREYGVITNTNLDEQTRREQLAASKVYTVERTGSDDDLEIALQKAGFDVQVHVNSPAVDPASLLANLFQMVAGGVDAYAGNQNAYAGKTGGELLVNGEIFTSSPAYEMQAGGNNAFAGNQFAVAGYFDSFNKDPVVYSIPTDPEAWPFIFFVGGDATRDGSGALIEIENAEVPSEREDEFKRLILQIKPMHSWAGLLINYT